jgi:hypothetical protein
MKRPNLLPRIALPLLLLASLAGCAGVYRLDNQVESFARWTDTAQPSGASTATSPVPQAPQRYRFERLPSQGAGPTTQTQDALEGWTQDALAPLGWTRANAGEQARWTVQVEAQHTKLPRAPWDDPWDGGRFGGMGGFASVHIGVGNGMVAWNPWFMHADLPYHLRRVSLVIRDSDNGRVVYETHARNDSRWNNMPDLWKAMLSAALAGFPTPPEGIRQVNLDVAR